MITTFTMIAGMWAGPVLNCYSGTCMPGFSWFTVAKDGQYHGQTIAKKPGADCLSHDPKGWTGQLYRLGKDTYYAINTDSNEGHFLQVSRDRQTASSTYVGVGVNVVESNQFYRTKINPDALLDVVRQWMCD